MVSRMGFQSLKLKIKLTRRCGRRRRDRAAMEEKVRLVVEFWMKIREAENGY
jgi:hypothetical protein